jgi:uncharacterized protein (DUF4415 family)
MTISQQRLADIHAIGDDQIDYSDIPEMGDAFFKTARLVMPGQATKQAVSIRVDEDVLTWFKAGGKGHLSRMNAVLRAYMLATRSVG